MKDHPIKRLEMYIPIADIHVKRIEDALCSLKTLLPLTGSNYHTLSIEQLGCLDLLTNRFAKLQDLIGAKIFPLLLTLLDETIEEKTAIDRLNILEKLHLLPSRQQWLDWREVRNDITHEYPCETASLIDKTNAALDTVQLLTTYWHQLRPQIIEIKNTYETART